MDKRTTVSRIRRDRMEREGEKRDKSKKRAGNIAEGKRRKITKKPTST